MLRAGRWSSRLGRGPPGGGTLTLSPPPIWREKVPVPTELFPPIRVAVLLPGTGQLRGFMLKNLPAMLTQRKQTRLEQGLTEPWMQLSWSLSAAGQAHGPRVAPAR